MRTALQRHPPHLAKRLAITIEAMQALAGDQLEPVFARLSRLHDPWSSAAAVLDSSPDIEAVAPVLRYLVRTDAR